MDNSSRRALLQLVREVVRDAASVGPKGSFAAPSREGLPSDESIFEARGAFVTLHDPSGGVRGCVGTTASVNPLVDVVTEMTRAAALRDPRFSPVRPDEVDGLEIEISVLEPLEPISSPDEVEIGRHGLVVEGRGARGLLLPQVATERDWNPKVFAEQTCRKAGLEPTAYLDEHVKLFRFGAEVFNEKEEAGPES